MKKVMLLILTVLFVFFINAQNTADKIAGNWYNEDLDKSTINIFKASDGFWYANIIKSADSKKIGKTLLSKIKFNAADNNYTGILTSPTNSMEIKATITLTTNGKLKLVGKKLFITKTYMFTQ